MKSWAFYTRRLPQERIIFRLLPVLLLFMGLEWVSGPVFAQKAPPAEAIPGYELLAEAGQLALSSKKLEAAAQPGTTLTQKRLALADKPVVEALDRMHRWLNTPLPPDAVLDPDRVRLAPLFSGARALGQALAVQSYVFLADGRVGEAIETLRDGLRIGYAIGNSTLAGWLSGYLIETTLADLLMSHRDQLAVRDCDQLLRLAQEWLHASDPLPSVVERMRLERLTLLNKFRANASFEAALQDIYEEDGGADLTLSQLAAQMERLTPQARQQMLTHVAEGFNTAFGQVQADLKTPYWERETSAAPKTAQSEDTVAKLFLEQALPSLDRIADRYARQQTAARLLGCHAAIERYRWEHDSLPPSLELLHLDEVTTDPFTGKPFLYKISGARYTLESVGPKARP